MFRRSKKARDPFGGDDDEDFYDDEPEERNIGRIIAYGLSGTMGLLLVGFIAVVVITADESAGPVSSSIPMEISQIVSEDGEVLQNLTTTTEDETGNGAGPTDAPAFSGTIAMPGLADTSESEPEVAGQTRVPSDPRNTRVMSDTTAATDRSVSRRPWLETSTVEGDRLDRDQPPPDSASQQPGRAANMQDLLRRSRENRPAPMPDEQTPVAPTPAALVDSDPDPMPDAEMAAEDGMIAATDTAVVEPPPASQPVTAAPMLPDPGLVPGAPRRFVQNPNADAGPISVGGAPRLVEPELPPTDSRAVSAAPPRFTTWPKAEQLASAPDAAARVAIIVEGLGLNRTATEAAIETLPSNVTLAFSPYARNLQDWLQKAIEAGHEVLVEVPMESNRYPADDPGPLGLLMSLDQIENVDRLSAILEEADGTVGILDVSGSRFRESEENINIVMNNLDARGLFYVQGRPGLRLGNNKVPSATADIVLDERAFRASIDARLDYVERLAKYQGSSVAVASAKPVTFERIALWLDEIGRRGVSIAPVSQVLIQ